ncbi:hypothetical protein [Halobellus ruber]|uniref:Uncharacterized protein n=1 Tax=Halobellus ruber TaxID=2761102 RepID=A0A7J9SEI5_9EURY|nr:hypothetical protein [Halobellus ruber]MBB6644813.1 hypothetical protein [Halobellus ruber]
MPPAVRGLSHLSLTVAPIVLLVAAALGPARVVGSVPTPVVWLVASPAVAGVAYVAGLEADTALRTAESVAPDATDAATVLAVAAGAPLTRLLAVDLGLGVVVAAALVGLLADRLVPSYGAAVYCGAFVGMASPALFSDLLAVTAAGLVAGVVFVAADPVFDGFGGKLGTTAFVGCLVAALALGADGGSGSVVTGPTVLGYVFAGAAAAGITYVSSVRLDHGPVQASALVGLVGGLICPALPAGEGIAAVVFCASFAGMARPERIPSEGTMALAGALCGLLVAAAGSAFVGFGGKLGTIAFVACLVVRGLLAVAADAAPIALPSPADSLGS